MIRAMVLAGALAGALAGLLAGCGADGDPIPPTRGAQSALPGV